MKKKLILGLTCSALLIAGCSEKVQEPIETANTEPSVIVVEETEVIESDSDSSEEIAENLEETVAFEDVEVSELINDFHLLLKAEYTSVDIVEFMESRIDEATPSEAEYMVRYLLLYQTEFMNQGNEVLFYQGYMDALNEDMGGILDASKIDTIANKTIRTFYQNLSDSYLTIVRYEETPVVETDWTRIDALNASFSEGFEYVVNARSYNGEIDYLDYYDIAERVLILEKMIPNEESVFVRKHMLALYDTWTNYLVVGPEGTHMESYIIKEDTLYKEMLKFSSDHETSIFGYFMKELVESDYEDYMDAYDAYDEFNRLDNLTRHQWTKVESKNGDSSIKSLKYFNKSSEFLTTSINTLISSTVNEVIEAIELPVDYKLEVFQYNTGEESVTLLVTVSYDLSDTERGFIEKYLNIDMLSGRSLSLAEYLQVSSSEVLKLVNQIAKTDFTMIPAYEKGETGIYLIANNEDTSKSRFVELSYKELIPYVKKITPPILEEVKTPKELFEESLEDMLISDMSTPEYVNYLEDVIDEVSPEQAEKLIETLMLFQSENIIQGDKKLDEEAYREAYFNLEDGELSTREIKKIEDEEIKDFFLSIENSYLRIRSEEAILELTLDWTKIADLDGTYSDAFSYLVEMRSDEQGLYDESTYDIAKNMVKLEVLEDKVTSIFVKEELEALFDLWANHLLIGVMGDNYETFVTKTSDLYGELNEFSQAYPESELGGFIKKIDDIEDLSYSHASGLIDAFILSENIGQRKWTLVEVLDGDRKIYQLAYQEIGNSEISDKVNATISTIINDLLEETINSDGIGDYPYTIESTHLHRGRDQVTLYVSIEYEQADSTIGRNARIVSIDLRTGGKIEFDTYIAVDEYEAITVLNELLDMNVIELPEFQVTESGVLLTIRNAEKNSTLYEYISDRRLIPYLNK